MPKIRINFLQALGTAIMEQIEEILGDHYSLDVKKAWTDFYDTIVKLMKQGFSKGSHA